MARQIIVIDYSQASATVNIACVFWLTAPAARVVPVPNFTSRIPVQGSGISWGITPAELAALQAGTVVEQMFSTQFPMAGNSNAIMQAGLLASYNSAQAQLAASANAGTHYVGASLDSVAGWSLGP